MVRHAVAIIFHLTVREPERTVGAPTNTASAFSHAGRLELKEPHIVGAQHVGTEDAVDEPAFTGLGQFGPVAEVFGEWSSVNRKRPSASRKPLNIRLAHTSITNGFSWGQPAFVLAGPGVNSLAKFTTACCSGGFTPTVAGIKAHVDVHNWPPILCQADGR